MDCKPTDFSQSNFCFKFTKVLEVFSFFKVIIFYRGRKIIKNHFHIRFSYVLIGLICFKNGFLIGKSLMDSNIVEFKSALGSVKTVVEFHSEEAKTH